MSPSAVGDRAVATLPFDSGHAYRGDFGRKVTPAQVKASVARYLRSEDGADSAAYLIHKLGAVRRRALRPADSKENVSQTSTVIVEDVSEKSGVSSKTNKPWKKWALKDGNGDWYGTFEAGVVTSEMKGKKYDIEWEPDGNFKNLLRATPHEESPIASRTETGEADWDLIGLRKTRCALWAALPDGGATAGVRNVGSGADRPAGNARHHELHRARRARARDQGRDRHLPP